MVFKRGFKSIDGPLGVPISAQRNEDIFHDRTIFEILRSHFLANINASCAFCHRLLPGSKAYQNTSQGSLKAASGKVNASLARHQG
jgi:hypothetical protein